MGHDQGDILGHLYSLSQAILKLSQEVGGHVVTHIEVDMYLITCNPGHI